MCRRPFARTQLCAQRMSWLYVNTITQLDENGVIVGRGVRVGSLLTLG